MKTNYKKEKKVEQSITLIVSSLKGGGAERICINLANYFTNKFSKVYLIVLTDKREYDLPFSKKINLIILKYKKAKSSILELIIQLNYLKTDYILSLMRDSNILLSISSIFLNYQKIIIFREANNFKTLNSRNFIFRKFLTFFYFFLYKRSDFIIANSRDTQKSLEETIKYKNSKITIIGNPVLSESFDYKKIKVAKHEWIKNQNLKVIIGVGRLNIQKDFPTLIKAFSIVLKKNENCRLIICGDGEEKKNLIALIRQYKLQKYIDMIGFTNQVYSYIKGSDIFCLTSLWEGFGNVLVEAMALGPAIISTSCVGISKELITNKKVGSLVPIKNSDLLAKEILIKLKEPSNKEMNMRIASEYSVSNIGEKYFETINSLKKNKI